ncbi:YidC family membrane integrase SpoIIIJ [Oceanobacillus profundus]|uniref:Membrane protein insertase YidC n=3 Tax=Bacteria TaxID=2 RepID=A0A417YHE9_9BACI|nr:YidC family membrane integrase SpoIIIJ [Oceanobacillus profundus]MCM3398070.1 YidC family membrane integrase SpoIIIJ [Oceanobacillus profundus]MDO6448018.1 YidC family membrane integrase SpoIIIJ [Oceanobacillus profundus]PAE27270.1 OxaA precursor [Paenibacillus sp. 7884-2]RHW32236.1 Membrane integrase YidC [Oceanobacillus profundus]
MRKKIFLLITFVGLMAILSGCTEINEPVTAESEGIWNTIFVYPLSWVIIKIAEIFNEGYGLSIVIVTILIRLLILPLSIKQLKSSKAMQEIQPKLQELQKKYSSKDATTQQKLQQETMQLFQKNGVNPLAGCLPIFVQMPILIAMYHAIMRTAEISTHNFLWFELGSPDYILPILTGAFTFLQQKLMMSTNSASKQNPQMAMQMQVMLYVMPIMIGVMAFFFPAALALYWVTGNIFMVVQTLLINKPMMTNK